MASSRRHGQRHHYDSVSSDTEYSEPEEHRKGCIKRSKYVLYCSRPVYDASIHRMLCFNLVLTLILIFVGFLMSF